MALSKMKIRIGNSRHGGYNSKYTLKGGKHDFLIPMGGNLRVIVELYHLEGDFESLQKERGNLENPKNVADFKEDKDTSTSNGGWREMEISQGK